MNHQTPEQEQRARKIYEELAARSPIHARDGSILGSPLTFRSGIPSLLQPIDPHGSQALPGPKPTPKQLISTEEQIAALWNAGELPYLTHLDASVDGSYEQWMCDFFHANVRPTDWVLASHRCHLAYQLHGGTDLIEQVKRGRSMFLYGPRFLCSAIVAGTASIAVGLALAAQKRSSDQRVFAFGGDGCEDHGHWMEAVFYSVKKNLPLQWIITDNDSSCGVTRKQRRGDSEVTQWPPNVVRFSYTPKFPHAGTGQPMTLKKPRR